MLAREAGGQERSPSQCIHAARARQEEDVDEARRGGGGGANGALEDEDADEEGEQEYLRRLARESARMKACRSAFSTLNPKP